MNITSVPSNFANAVSPFSPVAKQAVGEENTDSKNSSLKAIVESADSAKTENRDTKKPVIPDTGKPIEDKPESEQQNSSQSQSQSQDASAEQRQERQQLLVEQEQIRELASRDREVRNHERAHAAVGGQYAGAPVYQYERGPDGVSYAVSGEVSISTGAVSGDPQATISKAQQIKRAALAPADPSPQDRRVAASATQMEFEARQELAEIQIEKLNEEKESGVEERTAAEVKTDSSFLGSKSNLEEKNAEKVDQNEAVNADANRQINALNQRLLDIGLEKNTLPSGSIIKASA